MIILILLFMLSINSTIHAGSNAVDITDFSGSTRAAALGYTYTAIAQGVDSIFYNPAGSIFSRKGFELKTNSLKQFGDIQNTQLAFGWKEEKSDFVMSGAYYRSELSGIPVTAIQDNQQVQISSLSTVKQVYSLNFSTYLVPGSVSLGLNVKSYQYDFVLAKATGVGIDAGLLSRFEADSKTFIAMGFVMHNANKTALQWSTGHIDSTPRRLSLGTAGGVGLWERQIILAVDYHISDLNEKFYSLGIEVEILPEILKARAGNQSYNQGITLGLGLYYSGASFDFAYVPSQDLGDTFQYSLGLVL